MPGWVGWRVEGGTAVGAGGRMPSWVGWRAEVGSMGGVGCQSWVRRRRKAASSRGGREEPRLGQELPRHPVGTYVSRCPHVLLLNQISRDKASHSQKQSGENMLRGSSVPPTTPAQGTPTWGVLLLGTSVGRSGMTTQKTQGPRHQGACPVAPCGPIPQALPP